MIYIAINEETEQFNDEILREGETSVVSSFVLSTRNFRLIT